MKLISTLIVTLYCLFLTGCQSTSNEQQMPLASNKNFTHIGNGQLAPAVKPISSINKKPLSNDYALQQSLLSRPMTDDMKMILAFTRMYEGQQAQVGYVEIRGSKEQDPITASELQAESKLLNYNTRSIAILGPQQTMPE